jgi:flagellar assembly protein FliH
LLDREVTTSLSNLIRGRIQLADNNIDAVVIPVPNVKDVVSRPFDDDPADEAEAILAEAKTTAQEIMAEARREAERLKLEVEVERVRIFEQARELGLNEGRAEGAAAYERLQMQLQDEHASAMQSVTELAESIREERETRLRCALRPLPGVCMEVLHDLLGRELELAPANIEALVSSVITYVVDSAHVEVRVNPADYAMAQAAHPVWRSARYGEWELVVIPDPSIEAGGCEVRSDVGNIDATLKVKFELLQEALDKSFADKEVDWVGSVRDVHGLG